MKWASDDGVALMLTMMMVLLLAALGLSLALSCMAEAMISGSYASGVEALYAADAAMERVIEELATVPDWNRVLDGTVTCGVTDGLPGTRVLPDGSPLDLTRTTNIVRCGRPAGCSEAQIAAMTSERPWGANNPRWQLYASTPLRSLLPAGTGSSLAYVLVWVGDDAGESDGDPLTDADGTIALLVHAYGPGGTRRALEVAIARVPPGGAGGGPGGVRILSWREAA